MLRTSWRAGRGKSAAFFTRRDRSHAQRVYQREHGEDPPFDATEHHGIRFPRVEGQGPCQFRPTLTRAPPRGQSCDLSTTPAYPLAHKFLVAQNLGQFPCYKYPLRGVSRLAKRWLRAFGALRLGGFAAFLGLDRLPKPQKGSQ